MRRAFRKVMLNCKATREEVARWRRIVVYGPAGCRGTFSDVIRQGLEELFARQEREGKLRPAEPDKSPPFDFQRFFGSEAPAVEVLAPSSAAAPPSSADASAERKTDELVDHLARVHQGGAEPRPKQGKTTVARPGKPAPVPKGNGQAKGKTPPAKTPPPATAARKTAGKKSPAKKGKV